jgi:hypothetical protein
MFLIDEVLDIYFEVCCTDVVIGNDFEWPYDFPLFTGLWPQMVTR